VSEWCRQTVIVGPLRIAASPESDFVAGHEPVVRQKYHVVADRLGHEQMIERVAMVHRKGQQGFQVPGLNAEQEDFRYYLANSTGATRGIFRYRCLSIVT
jgi:hypothetical protein